MRPPHYTGENRLGVAGRPMPPRFNEAPALHGGKPASSPIRFLRQSSFNEAPALHGGKRQAPRLGAGDVVVASMRPPHYTGENDWYARAQERAVNASMRPPHYTGENALLRAGLVHVETASMRPPHYTGENEPAVEGHSGGTGLQ